MTCACLRHAFDPGIALNLRVVFDFDEGEDTRRAVESVMKVRLFVLIRSPPMYTFLGSPDVFRTKERAQQGVCEEATTGSWASSKACTFMLPFAQVTDQTGRFFSPRAPVDGQVMVHSRSKPIEQHSSRQIGAGTHLPVRNAI